MKLCNIEIIITVVTLLGFSHGTGCVCDSKYFINVLQVVIPASSVREVKKHRSALSMLSIQTSDGEKVRHFKTCFTILWFTFYFMCCSLLSLFHCCASRSMRSVFGLYVIDPLRQICDFELYKHIH